jgi:tetratricopeptide (TPR) repeat protein
MDARTSAILKAVLLALAAAGIAAALVAVRPRLSSGPYAGSLSCRECHERFYTLWSTSFHGLAMQPFTPELAASLPPQPAPLAAGDARYRVELGPRGGVMVEEGPRGTLRHPILHALGGKNVFYFLTPLDRGRLQTLPLAFDVNRKEWYDTAASAVRHFPDLRDERIDWRDPAYTFNTSCHSCHVSQLVHNYDPKKDAYRTAWAEPGINCETCHGPSAGHVQACREAPEGHPPRDLRIIVTKDLTTEQRNDMCSGCHAKMSVITPAFVPGERYFDHFDLVALENPDFHPDGRDLGENFTLTPWRMSPCFKSGKLDCIHCHTSSGRFRFRKDPDAACLPCHEGRARDVEAHTRHRRGTPGGRCVDCHMPMTEFARMRRSDHSMLPPTPAATAAFKSPNACTSCHADRDPAWADRLVREWHAMDYQAPVLRRAALVDAARKREWARLGEMLGYLREPARDEIVAASLIRLLGPCDDERKWPALLIALRDPSPLVRSSAAAGLSGRLTEEVVAALLAAVRDGTRLVRIRAAASLAGLPPDRVPAADRAAFDRAVAELEASYRGRPDDWSSRYNLGNVHLDRGDLPRAVAEYEAATRLRPDTVAPWVNLSMARARLGDPGGAEKALRRAMEIEPRNPAARFNLGLLLAEGGRVAEAEKELRAALEADPRHAAAAYNLGLMVVGRDARGGIDLLSRAWSLQPGDPRYGYSLGFHRARQKDAGGAMAVLRDTLSRHPGHADSVLLLAELLAREGQAAEAALVCRRALDAPGLRPPDRLRIERVLGLLNSPR